MKSAIAGFLAFVSSIFGTPYAMPEPPAYTAAAIVAQAQQEQTSESTAPADSAPQTQTIIEQHISQPVVERVIERAVSSPPDTSLLDRIENVRAELLTRLAAVTSPLNFSGPALSTPVSTAAFAHSQKIDQLSGTSLSNISISGVSGLTDSDIPDGITASNYLPLSGGALSFASSTLFSVFNGAYFGATATSSFDSAGTLTLATPLLVSSGGTGANTFGQGWIYSSGGTAVLAASTSPTVNYIVATSTTATSTFAGNVSVTGNLNFDGSFLQNGAAFIGSQWTTAGSNIFYSSGSIGIGTTSPWKMLSVAGDIIGTNITATGTMSVSGLSTFAGLISTASSTIGAGTQAGGLTISGGATTTGHLTLSGTAANVVLGSNYLSGDGGDEGISVGSTGNVGIGTASPLRNLDARGAIAFSNGTDGLVFDVTGGVARITGVDPGGVLDYNPIRLQAGNENLNQLYLATLGNVGIGNASPWTTLSVTGGLGVTASSTIGDGTQAGGLTISGGATTTGNAYFGGNVGIGTANPTDNLDIYSAADTGDLLTLRGAINTTGNGAGILFQQNTGSDLKARIQAPYVGSTNNLELGFWTSNNGTLAERVRIQGSGNVGIGSTTPYAKLSVKGAGTGTGVNFQTTNSSDSPLFSILDNGNVGIGTTNPSDKLHIKDGNLRIEDAFGGSGEKSKLTWYQTSSGAELASIVPVQLGSTIGLQFKTHDAPTTATKMTILGNGNVGIGNTSPWTTLSVTGGFAATASSTIGDGTQAGGLTISGGATTTGNAYIAGNVGIGTVPISKVHVRGGLLTITNGVPSHYGIRANAIAFAQDDLPGSYVHYLSYSNAGATAGNTLNFELSDGGGPSSHTNVLALLGSGNVGMGTTTPGSRLSVTSGLSVGANYGVAAPSNGAIIEGNVGVGTTNPNEGKLEVKGGTVCVDTDSDDTASSCIANESDERLKENIQPLTGSLDAILALRGVSFDWRATDQEILSHYPLLARFASSTHSLGLIAQEVQPIVPEAIAAETVGDAQVQYLQLDYTKFIPHIIEAIKEMWAALAERVQTKELTFVRATGDEIAVRKATVGELCAKKSNGEDICVTGDQLASILTGAGSIGNSAPPSDPQSSPDTEAPVITINGENPAHIYVGDTYSDLGASVTDNVDQNLGLKSYLNGALVSDIILDTSEEATSTIDYVATDNAGNAATSTRTIIVAPSSIP